MSTETLGLIIKIDDRDGPKIIKFTRDLGDMNQGLDKSKDKFGKTEEKLHKFTSAISKASNIIFSLKGLIAGVATALGLWKLEQIAKNWMTLSGAQEMAEKSLRQVMISMHRYSNNFYQSLLNQASAMQKVTGVGDELIIEGQKFLLTFKQIPDELMPRVTRTMLDLAALMGGDTTRAALTLGKAAMGMTGELRRVGITVDTSTFELKGFSGVLKEIEGQVKGQAETLGTGYGKWRIFSSAMGDAKEKVGDFFNAIFINTGLLDGLIKIVDDVNDRLQKFKQSADFSAWAKAMAITVANAFKLMVQSVKFFVEALEGVRLAYSKIVSFALPKMIENVTAKMEALQKQLEKPQGFLSGSKEVMEINRKELNRLKDVKQEYETMLEASQAMGDESVYRLELISNAFDRVINDIEKLQTSLRETGGKFQNIDKNIAEGFKNTKESIDKATLSLINFDTKLSLPSEKLSGFSTELKTGMIEKTFKPILIEWEEIAYDMAEVGKNALSDFLTTGRMDWEDFATDIRRIWADMIADIAKQKIFQPVFNQAIAGLTGNLYPSNFMGPLPQGAMYGNTGLASLGVGAMGYGATGNVGAGLGAAGGMLIGSQIGTIGGPLGALIGGAIGWAIEELISTESKEHKPWTPEELGFDLILETINSEINSAVDSWKGSTPHAEIALSLQKISKEQQKMFDQIASWIGEITKNITTTGTFFQISGAGSYQEQIQAFREGFTGKDLLNKFRENLSIFTTLGGKWATDAINDLFEKEIIPQMESNKKDDYETFFAWYKNLKTTEDDVKKLVNNIKEQGLTISGLLSPEQLETYNKYITEYNKALKEWQDRPWWYYGQDEPQISQKDAMADVIATLKVGLQDDTMWYAGVDKILDDFIKTFIETVQFLPGIINSSLISGFIELENTISNSVMIGIEEANYKIFSDNVKLSLADAFINLFKQNVIEKELQGLLIQPFLQGEGIATLMAGYASGEYSLLDVTTGLTNMFDKLDESFIEMEPIFNTLIEGINMLKESIDYNSLVTTDNTNALLDDIDKYIQDLTTGNLAPALSAATIQNTYDTLLEKLKEDPETLSTFMSYATGTYLPFFENYGGDYQNIWQSVIDELSKLGITLQGLIPMIFPSEHGYQPIPIGVTTDPNDPYRSSGGVKIYIDGKQIARAVMKHAENDRDSSHRMRRIIGRNR